VKCIYILYIVRFTHNEKSRDINQQHNFRSSRSHRKHVSGTYGDAALKSSSCSEIGVEEEPTLPKVRGSGMSSTWKFGIGKSFVDRWTEDFQWMRNNASVSVLLIPTRWYWWYSVIFVLV
jgi:hypothetical protein